MEWVPAEAGSFEQWAYEGWLQGLESQCAPPVELPDAVWEALLRADAEVRGEPSEQPEPDSRGEPMRGRGLGMAPGAGLAAVLESLAGRESGGARRWCA